MDKSLKQTTTEHSDRWRFMSDTQKLVRRHLQDRNHVITEEELRNIRVGMMPPLEDLNDWQNEEGRQRNSDLDPAGTPASRNMVEP